MIRTKRFCIFFFYFLFHSLDSFGTAEDTNSTSQIRVPPYRFPTNSREFKFLDNNEIRYNLSSHTNNSTDTELEDLNQPTLSPPKAFPKYEGTKLTNTEYIENNLNHKENKTSSKEENNKAPLTQGRVAATLVGVFVGLSVMAYVSLLLWRKYLEKKYGNREMLVNEDDFDRPDLKNFSI